MRNETGKRTRSRLRQTDTAVLKDIQTVDETMEDRERTVLALNWAYADKRRNEIIFVPAI